MNLHTSIANEGRDLVLRYRGDDVGYSRTEIGHITIGIDEYRGAPKVSINWPGCGDKDLATSAKFAADLTLACAIAAAAQQALAEEVALPTDPQVLLHVRRLQGLNASELRAALAVDADDAILTEAHRYLLTLKESR